MYIEKRKLYIFIKNINFAVFNSNMFSESCNLNVSTILVSQENPGAHTRLFYQHARTISDFLARSCSRNLQPMSPDRFYCTYREHTENPVYSHQARPAYRNVISPIGDISRDGVALKIREEIFFKYILIP